MASSATLPADRDERSGDLRRLRRLLAVGAVVLGAIGTALDGSSADALAVAAVAVLLLLSNVLSRRATDLRPWLVLDGAIGIGGVWLTGGAASPLLLALLAPLLLAGILRSVGVTAILLVAGVPAVLVGADGPGNLSIATVLVTVAIVGSSAEAMVARRRRADVLAAADLERVRLVRLSELLDAVDRQMIEREVPLTTRSLLVQVRRWMQLIDEPDLIAMRGFGPDGVAGWFVLGADDELRPMPQTDLPIALLASGGFAPVTTCPEVPPGEGLRAHSCRAAYLWLSEGGAPSELLVLEWSRPAPFSELEVQLLDRLRVLLEQLRSTQDRLERLRERSEHVERNRLAAQLHDELGQELLYVRMELERAARRHPDDAGLTELAGTVRDAVTHVRTTIGQLRADVRAPAPMEAVTWLQTRLGLTVIGGQEALGALAPHVRDVLVVSVERAVGLLREQGVPEVIVLAGEDIDGLVELRTPGASFDPRATVTSGLDLQLCAVGLGLSVTVSADGVVRGLRFGAVEDEHPGRAGGRPSPAAREPAS